MDGRNVGLQAFLGAEGPAEEPVLAFLAKVCRSSPRDDILKPMSELRPRRRVRM
jgi:hypothetical protein